MRKGALHDESESDNDADTDQESHGRHQAITSYDLPGANLDDKRGSKREDSSKPSGQDRDDPPEKTGNADQRQDDGPKARHGSAAAERETQDKPVKWGLTINMRTKGGARDGKETDSRSRSGRAGSEELEGRGRGKNATKSIDDEAMDALMGANRPKHRQPDSDAADREPCPEDYRSIPIDDFGATLLRGFGWDGKLRGKVKEVTRHANLTGLGAKDTKGAEDLGSWNQKTAKDSRPVRLDDYQREDRKKRQRIDDRHGDSYKRERERERDRERERELDRR
ncbi:hypothetical protein BT67DRAFT_430844 [Trichocladium antarcticum]|uniref:Spp2/MOS2 G-patch domain-containing protein n=1 Tax=Trichocladium antarcticum TaxID=1450529 RepID=A0AAN6ZH32_9PEZI|nr:hypothetical protein BT67DRAFT_430844 [Trichocladium antarcticum]